MKVIILPGVGFHGNKSKHEIFISEIKKYLPDDEFEVFYWQHDWPMPEIKLPYASVRTWLYEIILDFQQVIKHALTMEVPDADYYIGHSAGSILALVQPNPACITFGSPAVLVECIQEEGQSPEVTVSSQLYSAIDHKKAILNIINKYDQLAYYIAHNNVENYIYANRWWSLNSYNPYAAHEDYWSNKHIAKKIANQLKFWGTLDPK